MIAYAWMVKSYFFDASAIRSRSRCFSVSSLKIKLFSYPLAPIRYTAPGNVILRFLLIFSLYVKDNLIYAYIFVNIIGWDFAVFEVKKTGLLVIFVIIYVVLCIIPYFKGAFSFIVNCQGAVWGVRLH